MQLGTGTSCTRAMSIWLCLVFSFIVPTMLAALEVKMGRGGQDEPARKSGITSNEKKGSIVSCGPFLIP